VYPFSPSVRRLHALRLMGLLALAATILGTWQLGLRVTPGRPGVALAAAALVAFQPVVLQRGTALTPGPLALALCTWSLVGIADIASRRHLSGRRALALGALLGAAQIATRSAVLLLPVGLVAVLLRRQRGESWALTLRGLDRLVGGYVLVSGPWFAWNLTRYGDLLGSRYMPAGAAAPTWTDGVMAALLRDWTSYAPGLDIGGLALVVWVLVVAGGLTGLLYWQRGRGDIDARVWLLLMFAWLANLATAAGTVLPASSLHLTVAPLACVLAAGWATWSPRWAGVVGIFALATVAFHSQAVELGPSYWPPGRIHDVHFLALDPFESVPDGVELARLETVKWKWPPDRESFLRPPPLRWTPDPDPTARYTVHLVAPDRRLELRSYEDLGLPLRDRWTIPESLWDRLPTGARLYAQVLRLPRAADVATQTPWQGPVEHSEIRILYRIRPEDDL
jgi:hypothetical protein